MSVADEIWSRASYICPRFPHSVCSRVFFLFPPQKCSPNSETGCLAKRPKPKIVCAGEHARNHWIVEEELEAGLTIKDLTMPTNTTKDLATQHAVVDSMFFQRLPAELRRMMLIEAFGGRTLHADLEWDHPRQLRSRPTRNKRIPLGRVTVEWCGHPAQQRRLTMPPTQNNGGGLSTFVTTTRGGGGGMRAGPRKQLTSEPWNDTCLEGEAGWRSPLGRQAHLQLLDEMYGAGW